MLKTVISVLLAMAMLAIAIVIWAYISRFGMTLSLSHQEWSEFGDFFGGTIGTVLAFVSLLALLVTIYLQNLELRATRDELAETRLIHEQQADSLNEQVEIAKNEAKANLTFSMLERWASATTRELRSEAWDELEASYGFDDTPISLADLGARNPKALTGLLEVCQFISDLNKMIHLRRVDETLVFTMFFNSLYPWFEFIPRIEVSKRAASSRALSYSSRVEDWYETWVFSLQPWFERLAAEQGGEVRPPSDRGQT